MAAATVRAAGADQRKPRQRRRREQGSRRATPRQYKRRRKVRARRAASIATRAEAKGKAAISRGGAPRHGPRPERSARDGRSRPNRPPRDHRSGRSRPTRCRRSLPLRRCKAQLEAQKRDGGLNRRDDAEDRRRIDKWLWYARLAKTRTPAQALGGLGRDRVDRREEPSSASRGLKSATCSPSRSTRGVTGLACHSPRRTPRAGVEARLLYEDLSPPAPEPDHGRSPAPGRGRPSATAALLDAVRPNGRRRFFLADDDSE